MQLRVRESEDNKGLFTRAVHQVQGGRFMCAGFCNNECVMHVLGVTKDYRVWVRRMRSLMGGGSVRDRSQVPGFVWRGRWLPGCLLLAFLGVLLGLAQLGVFSENGLTLRFF